MLQGSLRSEAQLGRREKLRKDLNHLDLAETEVRTKDLFELDGHRHRNVKRLPLIDALLEQAPCGQQLLGIVPDDVADEDIGVERRHQRQGFISAIETCFPLGGLNAPAKSRIDLVLARTTMLPSGITCQTRRVPGAPPICFRTCAGTVVWPFEVMVDSITMNSLRMLIL